MYKVVPATGDHSAQRGLEDDSVAVADARWGAKSRSTNFNAELGKRRGPLKYLASCLARSALLVAIEAMSAVSGLSFHSGVVSSVSCVALSGSVLEDCPIRSLEAVPVGCFPLSSGGG